MSRKRILSKEEKRLATLAATTKAEKEKLLEQLNTYPIVQIACERAGVGRSTYYEWRKSDSEFAKRADEALGRGVGFVNDMAESMLVKNIKNGNNTAIIFWLKNHGAGYSDRVVHEHELPLPEELTEDERVAIARALMNFGLGSILKDDKRILEKAEKQRADMAAEWRVGPRSETVKPGGAKIEPVRKKPDLYRKNKKGVKIAELFAERKKTEDSKGS